MAMNSSFHGPRLVLYICTLMAQTFFATVRPCGLGGIELQGEEGMERENCLHLRIWKDIRNKRSNSLIC